MKSIASRTAPLLLLSLVAACGGLGGGGSAGSTVRPAAIADLPQSGPAADYPMVLGDAYQVGGVTYTPVDKLNYDIAGYAAVGSEGGAGVSVAERVLPMPSYVEVTDLASRRTILARVERRGPMTGSNVIELSPGAAAQLGLGADARVPVRVRRVNPPENERAQLRVGGRAPERIETPAALAAVLLRRIPGAAPAAVIPPAAAAAASVAPAPKAAASPPPRSQRPVAAATPVTPAVPKAPRAVITPTPRPVAAPTPRPVAAPTPRPHASAAPKPASQNVPRAAATIAPQAGTFVVQVGAFSTRARADTAAHQVGGSVSAAGHLFRVRSGPFTTRAGADAALAKAKGAGYSDARIQRAD